MPVKQTKLKGGKVRVSTPGGVKSKATTPANAKKQANLLRGVEHGWEPTRFVGAHPKKKGKKK